MTTTIRYASQVCAMAFGLGIGSSVVPGAVAGPVTDRKDQAPTHARCDQKRDDQRAWLSCVGHPSQSASREQLFYAGYWLARGGAYKKALSYLRSADQNDPRVMTYIGFSLRKLGDIDEAQGYYAKALNLDPNYNVARAYLGEAHLSQGNLVAAEQELNEIANRCGVHCAEHIDLADHIAAYNSAQRKKG